MQWFTRGRVRPVHDVPLLQDKRGSSSGGPSPTSSMEIKVPTSPSADASLSGRRQQLDIHTKCPAWAAYNNGCVLTVGGCLGAIVPGLQDTVQACCISTNETLLAVAGGSKDPRVLVFSISSHELVAEIKQHIDAVGLLAFSPANPEHLLSAGVDGKLVLSSVPQPGQPLHVLQHAGPINTMSVSHSGLYVASGSKTPVSVLLVHDLVTGQQVLSVPRNSWSVQYVNFAPCAMAGRGAVFALVDSSTTTLWDAATGTMLSNLGWGVGLPWAPHPSATFSRDGRRLVVNTSTENRVWDISDPKAPVKLQNCDTVPTKLVSAGCAVLNHNGSVLATGQEHYVHLWHISGQAWQQDTEAAPAALKLCHPEGCTIQAVRWWPDGSKLLTADAQGGCRVWSAESGALLWDLSTSEPRHQGMASQCCAMTGNGSYVMRGTGDGPLLVHALETKVPHVHILHKSDRLVTGLDTTPDGRLAIVAVKDGRVLGYDTSTGELLHQVDVGEKHPSHVLVGPDGDLVAIAGNPDPVVTLLRVSQGLRVVQKLRRDTPAGENFQGYEDVAFSPDGQLLAAACAGVRPIQVWSLPEGQLVFVGDIMGSVGSCSFSGDSKQLFGVQGEKILRWDTTSWQLLPPILTKDELARTDIRPPPPTLMHCIAHSHNGLYIAVTTCTHKVAVLDAATFEVKWIHSKQEEYLKTAGATWASWSPDDSLVLFCGYDGVTVLDARDGSMRCHSLDERCWRARMLPGNSCAVAAHVVLWKAGTLNGTALLWNVFSHVEVTPDAEHLQLLTAVATHWQAGVGMPLTERIKQFPALLHCQDAQGMSLAMHALVRNDESLFMALAEAAAEGSRTLRLLSCERGDAALKAVIAGGTTELMREVVMALATGKLMQGDQHALFWTLLAYLCSNHTALCIAYLQVCLRELGQVQQLVPVGQTVEMTTGVAPELQQGAPSIMWGEGGSVQRSAPAVHAKAAFSDRQLCSKQWMAASVLPLKGAAEAALPGEQPLLRRLVQADLPAFVFGLTAVRAVIQVKWQAYGKWLVLREVLLHSLLVAAFATYCLLLPNVVTTFLDRRQAVADAAAAGTDAPGGDWWTANATIMVLALALSSALVARDFAMEVRQWRTIGVKRAVASTWNLLDLGSLLLFGAIIVITIAITPLNTSDSSARNCFMALLIMCAMDSVMMWSRMLHYLRAFQTTGPLVRMIMEIIKDMKYFLLLVACMALGFGMAFFLLFSAARAVHGDTNPADFDPYFGTVPRTLVTMLGMMTGNFDQNLFWDAGVPWLAVLMFVVYVLLMVVVLFNLLIAIMGDSFQKVKDTEEVEFLKGRAEIIDELESMQPTRRLMWFNAKVQGYVHLLMPLDKPTAAGAGTNEAPGNETDMHADIKALLHQVLAELKHSPRQ